MQTIFARLLNIQQATIKHVDAPSIGALLLALLGAQHHFVFGVVIFIQLVYSIYHVDDILNVDRLVCTHEDTGLGVAGRQRGKLLFKDALHFVDQLLAFGGGQGGLVNLELAPRQGFLALAGTKVGDIHRHALLGHGFVVALRQE